jgi:hypothetical protein
VNVPLCTEAHCVLWTLLVGRALVDKWWPLIPIEFSLKFQVGMQTVTERGHNLTTLAKTCAKQSHTC